MQELLATPNLNSPAQSEAYDLLRKQPKEYERRVRAYAATVASPILGKALPVKNLVSKSAGVLWVFEWVVFSLQLIILKTNSFKSYLNFFY